MTVARSPGSAICAARARSTGSARTQRVPPEHRVGCATIGIVDDHDVREVGEVAADRSDALEVRDVLDDHDLRPRVVHEVPDLVFRRRAVDRDRRATDEQHGDVGDMELGAVPEQHRDSRAAAHAELGERRGDPGRAVPVLGVRQHLVLGAVLPAQCRGVGVALDRAQEQAGDGLAGHTLVELIPGDRSSGRAHDGSFPVSSIGRVRQPSCPQTSVENLWARVEKFGNLGDTVAQYVPRRALGRPV